MFIIVLLLISDVKRIYEAEPETIFAQLGPEFEFHRTDVKTMNSLWRCVRMVSAME